MRYRAFISYSHADARWASWLHRSLEGYRVPSRLRGSAGEFGPLPDRLVPIFRDREELASAGQLGPKIEAALEESEALVVICSPTAAQSPWVNEEVLRFKQMGRANRIYCLIVAGEPHADDKRECFAPSLRYELDAAGEIGANLAEPIAADVRPGTDGKPLARLKLLAGLLGLDLDTLRRRESARRHRRLLFVAAMALLVALVTSFLAVQAMIARNTAERRQKQAESLVAYMLGDLNEKLSKLSRLDLLESVNDQAMSYFAALPSTDVTDLSLEQRAKMLVQIGNVRRDQGRLPEALKSFEAANLITEKLARASPTEVNLQLAHADTLSYIGTVSWYQGDLDKAEKNFEAAQGVLVKTKELAPANPQLLFQLSTLDNNFGHVLESRGRLDDAARQYQGMLKFAKALTTIDRNNGEWAAHLGQAHKNLGNMALLRGDLANAVAEYQADVDIQAGLAARDAADSTQAEKLVLSRAALGRTMAMTGAIDPGIDLLQMALDEASRLLAIEPSSAAFQEDVALYSTQLAYWRRVTGHPEEAGALARQGSALYEQLTRKNPDNPGWSRGLAEAWLESAAQARDGGNTVLARRQAHAALAALEPMLAQRSEDRGTVLATVGARLLVAGLGDATAQSHNLLEQNLTTIQSQSSGQNDARLLALQVESLLALNRHAEAETLLPPLWKTGYRNPAFVETLRRHDLGAEVPPIGTPKSR